MTRWYSIAIALALGCSRRETTAIRRDEPNVDAAVPLDASSTKEAAGTIAKLASGSTATLHAGAPSPVKIATDGAFLYFTAHVAADAGIVAELRRAPRSLSPVTTLAARAGSDGLEMQIAVDDGAVYWRHGNELLRVPKAGGTPSTIRENGIVVGIDRILPAREGLFVLSSGELALLLPKGERSLIPRFEATSFALAGADVLATFCLLGAEEAYDGGLMRVPRAGGASARIVTKQITGGCPTDVVIEGSDVLWTQGGSIFRLAAAATGGPPTVVTTATKGTFERLVADASAIHAITREQLVRVDRSTGATSVVARADRRFDAIAADATHVWVVERDTILRVAK